MRLPYEFHRPAVIFASLDVSKADEVCKVCRSSGDVSVIARCEGADGNTGIPRLVVPRLFDAEGSQGTKGDRIIFIGVIEKVFKFRGETCAFSSPWKERMQETLELFIFLGINPSACGALKAHYTIPTLSDADD